MFAVVAGSAQRLRQAKAPNGAEIARFVPTGVLRIGRNPERQRLMELDTENSSLADAVEAMQGWVQ